MLRRTFLLCAASVAGAALSGGCQAPESPQARAETRREIDAGIPPALQRLYRQVPGSEELANKAAGILTFPSVVRAGIGIGGEFGRGALQVGGRTTDYYELQGGSLGLQLGAEWRSVALLFMTQEALDAFRSGSGWQAGVHASVAMPQSGSVGNFSTTASRQILAYVFDNSGLMLNASLEGVRIRRIDL